jgi:glutathione S-transferase
LSKYVLHNRLGSGGFVIEAALTLAGLDFDYAPLASVADTTVAPLVQDLNPWGQVPVLIAPQGDTLTEVAAMIIWLAQNEPACRQGPDLWVENDAAFMRWSVFLAVNVYEGILRDSYPQRYIDLGSLATVSQDDAELALRRAAHKRVHAALRVAEDQCSQKPFLLGIKLSMCDLFLAMLYAWHNEKPDLPNCTAITQAVAQHSVIAPIWHRNFSHRLDKDWLKHPAN